MNIPTVRFYLLPEQAGTEARLHLTCLLCEKAQQESLKTVVVCADEDMALMLDERLWAFRPTSFITHCRIDDPLADKAAVLLCVAPERVVSADVQINLSDELRPDIPRHCQRICEIVSRQDSVLRSTRARYAAYCAGNCQPQIHRVSRVPDS